MMIWKKFLLVADSLPDRQPAEIIHFDPFEGRILEALDPQGCYRAIEDQNRIYEHREFLPAVCALLIKPHRQGNIGHYVVQITHLIWENYTAEQRNTLGPLTDMKELFGNNRLESAFDVGITCEGRADATKSTIQQNLPILLRSLRGLD